MFIAESPDAFRALFADRLEKMLETGSLGAFILVLANSMQDVGLRQRLAAPLQQAFDQLRRNTPDAPLDDAVVFDALRKTGLQPFAEWESRQTDPWRLNFNPLRALRPPRASGESFTKIRKPFKPEAFHFDKPFLEPEILWRGTTQNLPLTVLYNKFPFAPFHLLVAPETSSHLPQFLTGEHHTAMWRLLEQQADTLLGLRFTYNSIGAGASVNHLHFQGFISEPLPVENTRWSQNGGDTDYPLPCQFHQSVCDAWKAISEYQKSNQPFNLLYSPGGCHIFARKPAGDNTLPDWARGAAWAEVCGLFTFSRREDFDSVGKAQIEDVLRRLGLGCP